MTTQNNPSEMAFVDHLRELRRRLVYCLAVMAVCFVVLFVFANQLYNLVSEPLRVLLPQGATMIATDVTSPFFAPFRLALFFSLVISMPVILLQVWLFIAPGLYKTEKRFAIPMFIFSVALFYAGMAFAYFIVFKLIFGFFLTVGPDSVVPMTDITSYLNFILKILIAFGLAFQIPIATLLLLRAGLVDLKTLARQRAYIFVGCFILGMLITPPDVFSQAFVAFPMWLLFELGLLLHKLVGKTPEATDQDDKHAPNADTQKTAAKKPAKKKPAAKKPAGKKPQQTSGKSATRTPASGTSRRNRKKPKDS